MSAVVEMTVFGLNRQHVTFYDTTKNSIYNNASVGFFVGRPACLSVWLSLCLCLVIGICMFACMLSMHLCTHLRTRRYLQGLKWSVGSSTLHCLKFSRPRHSNCKRCFFWWNKRTEAISRNHQRQFSKGWGTTRRFAVLFVQFMQRA